MTASIEFLGQPVAFAGAALVRVGSTVLIPTGALVTVCSWCPGQRAHSLRLLRLGYHVTHGLCANCEAQLAAAATTIGEPQEATA